MSKKSTFEERKKLVEAIIKSDFDLNCLNPIKKPIESLKPLSERLESYHLIIEDSVFWASRETYLKLLQSFLLKKIDGKTLTCKFFQLRTQNLITREELCLTVENRILPIPDLYYTFKARDFSYVINQLYLEIDQ